ncbi:MAG: type II toxin-antitoxin system Phd/YefM family antitoxin [candidate division Zixibacteria bacterium]|nr:type II toxin-antitoxin system Phd/YefM family antitoxin [candidate division Zixibacteria bacterium]
MKVKTKSKSQEIIFKDGKPKAIILDIEEYQEMLERLEDTEDLKTLEKMRKRPLRFRRFEEFLLEVSGPPF